MEFLSNISYLSHHDLFPPIFLICSQMKNKTTNKIPPKKTKKESKDASLTCAGSHACVDRRGHKQHQQQTGSVFSCGPALPAGGDGCAGTASGCPASAASFTQFWSRWYLRDREYQYKRAPPHRLETTLMLPFKQLHRLSDHDTGCEIINTNTAVVW